MPSWALAVTSGEDELRLLWKVQRNAAGDVSCVDYASPRGAGRPGFAGMTWRGDGHFHLTEAQGRGVTRHRRPLAQLRGPERAYGSPALSALARTLPPCERSRFDGVFELSPAALGDHPERKELHLDLMPAGSASAGAEGPPEELPHWLLTDASPWIAIAVREYTPDVA